MQKLCTVLVAGVFLLAAGSQAFAGDGGKGKKKMDVKATLKKLDTNNDGKLSKDEFSKFHFGKKEVEGKRKKLDHLFGTLDKNNDGFLSMEEFEKVTEHRKKK